MTLDAQGGLTEPCEPRIDAPVPARISLASATRVWARIGLLGFGGPAGQIALMHRELVDKHRFISEPRFLHALSYCMLLPGPEAQQLAVYIGWMMHGRRGGLVAGTLFVLPGFVIVLALAAVYALFAHVPWVAAVFFGLKAAVMAIVVDAVIRIGRRAVRGVFLAGVSAVAFVAIYALRVPFPFIVLGAAALGAVVERLQPTLFPAAPVAEAELRGAYLIDALLQRGELEHTRPDLRRAVATLVVGLLAWAGPLALVAAWLGPGHVVAVEGAFFGKAAVVTFSGAYAVLAYVAQRAVETYGWLTPGEMVDGLGLAETTPGPLIMVVEFVGFLGAFRAPAPLGSLAAGVLGAVVTTWATFAPCFLWIFLGGPYVEALRRSRVLRAALTTVTASVVGVIINLSLWFALHTAFDVQRIERLGALSISVPVLASVQWPALVLAVAASIALLGFRLGVERTLAMSAAAGLVWSWLR